MFRRVLIANRGEIALRIVRTLREMGITSVAAFSDADRDAPFVDGADEAFYLGPSPATASYLNVEAVVALARQARVDAVHPGYGFLSENPAFAEAIAGVGLAFIGPPPAAMRLMGDKVRARAAVQTLGVPVIPGTDEPVKTVDEALQFADRAGYPVAVKAAGGGGGRGIRVVRESGAMESALETATREADAYFRNPSVYLEKYFDNPRHVEIQVLGDGHGTLVHLGERDCSVQRRHQKLIEESPSPAVNRDLRQRMGEAALQAARSAGYQSAGTVEFLLTDRDKFYFLEMNTRIQVEHPVTEMITGHDLIQEMILAAADERLTIRESILDPFGHAIEVRINAEDPQSAFRATPSPISLYREPGGIGTRVDSGVRQGYVIPGDYDSLMAKLIVWAPGREAASRRALRALGEFEIAGPASTIPFAQAIIRHATFATGDAGTAFVSEHLGELTGNEAVARNQPAASEPRREKPRIFDVDVNRKRFRVQVAEVVESTPRRQPPESPGRRARLSSGDLLSPMHGTILDIKRGVGDGVTENESLIIVEAMKMENEITAHRSGILRALHVSVGDTVELDQKLATID